MRAGAWSAQDDGELRRLWASGRAAKLIARELGRTHHAVSSRVLKLGLPNRRFKADSVRDGPDEVMQLTAFVPRGLLDELVAASERSGLSLSSTVREILKAAPIREFRSTP